MRRTRVEVRGEGNTLQIIVHPVRDPATCTEPGCAAKVRAVCEELLTGRRAGEQCGRGLCVKHGSRGRTCAPHRRRAGS